VDKRAIAGARAIAKTEAYAVSCRQRKKVEMLFACLKRILGLDRLRLRGPSGAKDEFLLAATAQNRVCLTFRADREHFELITLGKHSRILRKGRGTKCSGKS
jgi:Transposase DDE domain